MSVKIKRLDNGWFEAEGYIFTHHFFKRWRGRKKRTHDRAIIVNHAVNILKKSELVRLYSDGTQKRRADGTTFTILSNGVIVTVVYDDKEDRNG